jgi:hypothetical protein
VIENESKGGARSRIRNRKFNDKKILVKANSNLQTVQIVQMNHLGQEIRIRLGGFIGFEYECEYSHKFILNPKFCSFLNQFLPSNFHNNHSDSKVRFFFCLFILMFYLIGLMRAIG